MNLTTRMTWGLILAAGLAPGWWADAVHAAPLTPYELKDQGVVSMPGDGSYLTLARDNPVRVDDLGNVAVQPPTSINLPSIGTVWVTDSAGDHQVGYTLNASTGQKELVSITNGQGQVHGGLGADLQYHYGMAVNSLGTIIGRGKLIDGIPGAVPGPAEDTAFAISPASPNTINLFAIGGTAHPFGINDAGQLVGATVSNGITHAYLAETFQAFGTQGTDLNQVLDPSGHWVFNVATDINNRGEIAGYATDGAGQVHAVELVPVPEPTALATLAAGVVIALFRRRRR